jgi:hypothetical protein
MVACTALCLALAVSACGGGGRSADTGATVKAAPDTAGRVPSTAASRGCGAQLTRFVRSLDGLRDQLAVGLTYDQYLENVRNLQRAYRQIPVDEEPARCVVGVGVPAERALNRHIEAANTWGDCLAESCELSSVEPDIKRSWAGASVLITDAQEGLSRQPLSVGRAK